MKSNAGRFIILFTFILLWSCKEDSHEPVIIENNISIILSKDKWVYYSIPDMTIIGQSDIDNKDQDDEWYERTDWDIAFSENGIRTNSGTSGVGRGGLKIVTDNLSDYKKDTLGVVIPVGFD